jgi:hypothetical protein
VKNVFTVGTLGNLPSSLSLDGQQQLVIGSAIFDVVGAPTYHRIIKDKSTDHILYSSS